MGERSRETVSREKRSAWSQPGIMASMSSNGKRRIRPRAGGSVS